MDIEGINSFVLPFKAKACYIKNTADPSYYVEYPSLRLAVKSLEGLNYSTASEKMRRYNVVEYGTYKIFFI